MKKRFYKFEEIDKIRFGLLNYHIPFNKTPFQLNFSAVIDENLDF